MVNSVRLKRSALLLSLCAVACAAVFFMAFAVGTAYAADEGGKQVSQTSQPAATSVEKSTPAVTQNEQKAASEAKTDAQLKVQAGDESATGDKSGTGDKADEGDKATTGDKTDAGDKSSDTKDADDKNKTDEVNDDDPGVPEGPYEETHTNMYRLYNPNSGEHFYTGELVEAQSVASAGWRWEGIGWVAPITSKIPVYRLYNPNAGDHHYTLEEKERDNLVSLGWNYEGIGWYSDGKDQLAVYRQYNPNAVAGAHNFTTDASEDAYLGEVGWNREGIAWYATNGEKLAIQGFWLVTDAWGSLERYWVQSDAIIATSRFLEADEVGWTAYATDTGAVVRGKYDRGDGYVYVADNDGRLAATASGEDGWLVTDAYDGGMQRYYYVAAERAMRSGFFEIDGAKYFGMGGQGYVLRGRTPWGDHMLLANNDGHLATGSGWLVTDIYEGSMRRYWLESAYGDYMGAKCGFFDAEGNKYYGNYDTGYVTTNDYARDGGTWYWANNDGVLAVVDPPGWFSMSEMAQGYSSPTGYLLMIDNDSCHVGVFSGYEGNWNMDYYWDCANGRDDAPTVRGTYYLGDKGYSFGDDDHTCFYYSQISGNYLFHSILYEPYQSSPRDDNIKFDGLGGHYSNGCVRLATDNAYWIYDNVPSGTKIVSYN